MAMFKRKKVMLFDDNNRSNCVGLIQCIKDWESGIEPKTDFSTVNELGFGKNTSMGVFEFWKPISLNIISNEKLKSGDWFVWKNEIHQYHSDAGYGIKTWTCFNKKDNSSIIVNHSNVVGKIIASTDVSLNLPEPSKSFVNKYIDEFNKGNIITDVMVEYNSSDDNMDSYVAMFGGKPIGDTLKTNSDGIITIRKIKDNWNRDEVAELIKEFSFKFSVATSNETHNWIDENL